MKVITWFPSLYFQICTNLLHYTTALDHGFVSVNLCCAAAVAAGLPYTAWLSLRERAEARDAAGKAASRRGGLSRSSI